MSELDRDLENIKRQAEEVTQQLQEETMKTQEEMMQERVLELLRSEPDAPSGEQIAQWKERYGDSGVHVIALAPGDVYVFTHLTLGDWNKIQEIAVAYSQAGLSGVGLENPEFVVAKKILRTCILWPKFSDNNSDYIEQRAGLVGTLVEVIRLHSFFLTPGQAMSITTQL